MCYYTILYHSQFHGWEPQDSRFKSIYSTMYRHQSYKTTEQCEKTNQNISWWVHVWRPSLRPYGRYHKGHQKMFGSTGRIKVSRYDSNNNNNNKKKIMITDSFKMADVFVGDRTGGAVAQTSAQMIGISMWQGRMWLSRLQGMHGSRWWVVVRANSAIVDPRDAAVAARGWCSISFLKTTKGSLTTKSPIQNQCHTL